MTSNTAKALGVVQKAVAFDNSKNYEAATYYYKQAAKLLYLAIVGGEGSEDDRNSWRAKIAEYEARATILHGAGETSAKEECQSAGQQALQRCNFLFGQALDADERSLSDIAIDLYGQTAEYALSIKSTIADDTLQRKIMQRAEQAVTRAEELKFSKKLVEPSVTTRPEPSAPPDVSGFEAELDSPQMQDKTIAPRSAGGYSEDEKRVLLSTSKINGINYVPFMDIDLKERFQYALPFTDKHGLLKLSPKQQAELGEWRRPEEIYPDPKMLRTSSPDFYCIKQTIVSDCSFVASLAVSAQYERKFNKRIITPIIFPRNRNKEPIYNPFGKYMVKLHINGVPRKVIIDDLLPVDRHGRLLCSYSTQKGELWVSLLEKAYMKVMGGYDFPGSNSNIDLHALTGWIPERISIRPGEAEFNGDAVFSMLESRLQSGHCLGTVATGDLSTAQEDRTGLVPTHAYAILNVRTVNGVRLMQLKNPWSHIRWRGNYSELDASHWTSAMRTALNFDPDSAASFDNGIFWIDYESILHFFDVFYINWNPTIFSYTHCTHHQWLAGQGPSKDVYNMGENPQYRLHIASTKPGSVWVQLIRHITDLEDFKNNREFMCVLVYKTNGNKVYYPGDPPPYIDGVRINSPQYLCKIKLGDGGSRDFTLVISQYEKTANIYYTLRTYSTLPFKLERIVTNYAHVKEVSGQWKGTSAGGCANYHDTHVNNPCYHFQINAPGRNELLIDLKGPKQYQVGFTLQKVDDQSNEFGRKSSGAYRSGFVVLELQSVSSGTYSIVPTTFYPNQEGPFILTVKATCPLNLTRQK